ncbi:MAG: DNA mismatch repair protein MutS [Weeksellaceae bacterium]
MPETQAFNTPMMLQYLQIKKQYKDCLLFFRMGDFYELFLDDAKIGSEVLGITLTSRSKGKDGRIPMAGVPYHAVDAYLANLVKAGYKVAICEQMSLPQKGAGIVDREVVRIVTPGTFLDNKNIDEKENNFIIALDIDKNDIGVALADLSTGQFTLAFYKNTQLAQCLGELQKFQPKEYVIAYSSYAESEIIKALRAVSHANVVPYDVPTKNPEELLVSQFGKSVLLDELFTTHKTIALAAVRLLAYLYYTQKDMVRNITTYSMFQAEETMQLDQSTITNLELFQTSRDADYQGSFIQHIDHTITAPAGRMIRAWVRRPLATHKAIQQRHVIVELLGLKRSLRSSIRRELKGVADVERLLSRIALKQGNPRDVVALKQSVVQILNIEALLQKNNITNVQIMNKVQQKTLQLLADEIQTILEDEPPIDTKEGGLIKKGVNAHLDELRSHVTDNKSWLTLLQEQERSSTGISSLKVQYNKVFGFYIEISKANAHLAPAHYIRKQTLVNGERYITEELKKKEEIILQGEAEANTLELELYQKLIQKIIKEVSTLQQVMHHTAELDCLASFAELAELYNYVRPIISPDNNYQITQGRHPVVEQLIDVSAFVPNDTVLSDNQQLFVITGPNMAGKSVYLRQVALITLMNQIGSFVPAHEAKLPIVDAIYVRSGAADVMAKGLSTFMVEMVETADILRRATSRSLVIMDEIGRGTSTFDGISIAWAVAQYLVEHATNRPKTLFATHYHELQELEHEYPDTIKNFHMVVTEEKGKPVFLHTLAQGAAPHSYGVAVAQLAGLPKEVTDNAYKILQTLEKRETTPQKETKHDIEPPVVSMIKNLDINSLTPIEALQKLDELKKKLA